MFVSSIFLKLRQKRIHISLPLVLIVQLSIVVLQTNMYYKQNSTEYKFILFITDRIILLYWYFFLISRDNSCITPPYQLGTSYLVNDKERPKGTTVDEFTVLTYKCGRGFVSDNENFISVCLKGKWFPSDVKCKRECYVLLWLNIFSLF